jgi:hypothetical protein
LLMKSCLKSSGESWTETNNERGFSPFLRGRRDIKRTMAGIKGGLFAALLYIGIIPKKYTTREISINSLFSFSKNMLLVAKVVKDRFSCCYGVLPFVYIEVFLSGSISDIRLEIDPQ